MQHALKNRWVKIGLQAAVLTALILGLVSFLGANKTVALTVDGETRSVQTFGSTVADALASSEVSLATGDQVVPGLDAAIQDGTAIQVNTSKSVNVSIDGVDRVVSTTGLTVSDILAQLGVSGGSEVSLAGQLELASLSTPLEITTPKSVKIVVDGKTKSLDTTAETVKDLLAEAGIKVGKNDEVSRKLTAEVKDGMKVKVVDVKTKKVVTTKSIAHGEDKVEDDSLAKGKEKVLKAGKDGERKVTYEVVFKDGKAVTREIVSSEVTTEPVDTKIAVGTKEAEEEVEKAVAKSPSSGGGTSASSASVSSTWSALAQCESGGNWAINTGNGYYGGLQFSLSSWQAVGGTQYAAYPHQATPAEQVAAAEVLRSSGGWGHWPACSSKLGLR